MAKQMALEEAIKRIEEIAAKMEGELGIDESIALYTEAVKLIDLAGGRLDAAKQKVEKLTKAKEGMQDDASI